MIENIYDYSRKKIAYSLYGTMLGDAYLRYGSPTSCWIAVKHSQHQTSYVQSLEYLFNRWGLVNSSVYDYKQTTAFGDSIYSEVRVKLTPPIIRQIKRLFPNRQLMKSGNRKIVTSYVMKRLTPLGLLFWYLDDGSLSINKLPTKFKRHGRISSQSFSEHENLIIQKYLDSRFGIKTCIEKAKSKLSDKIGYLQGFGKESMMRLIDVIYPVLHFIPECMLYKIDMQFRNDPVQANRIFSIKYDFINKEDLLEKQKKYCNS